MRTNFNHGYLFPFPVRLLGYAILFLSLFAIVNSIFYGILLLILGIFIGFSNYGAEIDISKHRIREYSRYLAFKSGKWFAFSEFSYISVRDKKISTRVYFSSNQSFTMKDEKYEIFITDFLLRKKVLITEKKSRKEAENFAFNFKEITLPFKNYSEIVAERKLYLRKAHAAN